MTRDATMAEQSLVQTLRIRAERLETIGDMAGAESVRHVIRESVAALRQAADELLKLRNQAEE